MIRKTCDVAVVGGGLSGLVAATTLVDRGLRVLLLDENIRMGGQALKSPPWSNPPSWTLGPRRYGFGLIDRVKRKSIEVLTRTKVLDVDEQKSLLIEREEKEIFSVAPRVVLLATGARERFMPFKGWTLPGVISTGAAQILMKGSGVLPAREMVVAGIGPFLLALSAEFLGNRGKLLSILDTGRLRDKLVLATTGLYSLSKLMEGFFHLVGICRARVPLHHGTAVVEARGGRELEKVIAAKISRHGNILQGTEKRYQTGCLAVGWGLTPNIELARIAGSALEFDNGKGGWVVGVNEDLETSVDGVFAAGEITGIAGALKSIHEGEMAAYGILKKLGKEVDSKRVDYLKRKRRGHLRFGNRYNRLHRLPDQMVLSIPDEVVICRCEDVRMGDIRAALKEGYDEPGTLKKALRIGMGNCQGRTCGHLLYDILSALTRRKPSEIPLLSVRSPVKPVAIGSFLK
jgi:D-hydroxyproline dehydrogenase subunit alpha